ncbi:MAG TPA: hypothetical protein PKD54_16375 [Pirellulaceae bacterium]|nr:hypothetical protein [Pirellulaceae bacterium]
MEFSLHKQLKEHYRGHGETEVRWGTFRIDVVNGDQLIEIQLGSLSAIRRKIAALLQSPHALRVVKPLIAQKQLIKLDRRQGKLVDRRLSPKRQSALDIVHDLVYLKQVFPHPNLTIETPLISVREIRYPGRGRRRRRRPDAYQIQDIELVELGPSSLYCDARDLLGLVPEGIKWPWDTGDLARCLDEPRWIAQRLAYCLRHAGAIRETGRRGNARVYDRARYSVRRAG